MNAPPLILQEKQKWFASIITQPLGIQNKIPPKTSSGASIKTEAAKHIAPSPTLEPWERIQIYHQQYWWRILAILHENYPLLLRLFGYTDFNQTIGISYMKAHPSNHWAIDLIGAYLPEWLDLHYAANDKQLVCEAAALDCAFTLSFFSSENPPIEAKELQEAALHKKAFLQPHLYLFSFHHDLPPFRKMLLHEEPEYWIEHDFPSLGTGEKYHYTLYRNRNGDIAWDACDPLAFSLLQKFQKGCSISEACHWLEAQEDRLRDEAAAHIHFWFQEWTIRQWLTFHPPVS